MAARAVGRRLGIVIPVVVLLLALSGPSAAAPPQPGYHISGNRIVDGAGQPFIVKGADAIWGRFAGGDANGFGLLNYQNAARDLDNLKLQGVNLIRVETSYSDYIYGPVGQGEYLLELDRVVALVTQRGMVAEISQGWAGAQANVVTMARLLADRYSANPLVWIQPDNEPNCNSGDTSKCLDWGYWQTTQQQNIQAIRAAGNTQPVVIDCIGWAWDCSQIGSYPLGDSNVLYGAKRYGNGASTWESQQVAACDFLWANLAGTYPIYIDEVGLENGPGRVSPPAWGAAFLDYATNWVRTRGGNGVIGFVDAWYTNSMTNSADGSWTTWGQTYIAHWLSVP